MKKSLVIIKEFSVETVIDSKLNVNDLDELSNTFFTKLRNGQPGTPSRMRGNIFDKKRKAETLAVQVARKEASKKRRLI